LKVFLVTSVVFASILAWGYWHSSTHASMSIQVIDYGLKTDRQVYGTPHDVTLTFFGSANEYLASARSVEPAGYVLAIHPDSNIGDCSKHQNSQQEYADCYAQYSIWASSWAPWVRTAAVSIGGCTLHDLPVNVSSNANWWLWWVPHPHIGGIPRRHFELMVKVDTKSCTSVSSETVTSRFILKQGARVE
jgi:hypothetical protein